MYFVLLSALWSSSDFCLQYQYFFALLSLLPFFFNSLTFPLFPNQHLSACHLRILPIFFSTFNQFPPLPPSFHLPFFTCLLHCGFPSFSETCFLFWLTILLQSAAMSIICPSVSSKHDFLLLHPYRPISPQSPCSFFLIPPLTLTLIIIHHYLLILSIRTKVRCSPPPSPSPLLPSLICPSSSLVLTFFPFSSRSCLHRSAWFHLIVTLPFNFSHLSLQLLISPLTFSSSPPCFPLGFFSPYSFILSSF